MRSPSARLSHRLLATVRYLLAGATGLAALTCSVIMLWHLWDHNGVMASASAAASSVFFTTFTALVASGRPDHRTASLSNEP